MLMHCCGCVQQYLFLTSSLPTSMVNQHIDTLGRLWLWCVLVFQHRIFLMMSMMMILRYTQPNIRACWHAVRSTIDWKLPEYYISHSHVFARSLPCAVRLLFNTGERERGRDWAHIVVVVTSTERLKTCWSAANSNGYKHKACFFMFLVVFFSLQKYTYKHEFLASFLLHVVPLAWAHWVNEFR